LDRDFLQEIRDAITGTDRGAWRDRSGVDAITDNNKLDWVSRVLSMIMNDTSWQNHTLLEVISRTQTPWQINSKFGVLSGDLLTFAIADLQAL
jgi:hypothetical protein